MRDRARPRRRPAHGGIRVALRALAVAGIALASGCGGDREPRVWRTTDPDSIPEAYARSTAALAWPGATRAFQVTPEGDLTNGDWVVRLRPSCGVPASPPGAIAFEDRWLPVAHWRRWSGPVRWDFEAAALPEAEAPAAPYRGSEAPAPRDTGLVVSLEIRATNTGTAPCDARLDVELGDLDSSAVFVAFDAPEVAPPRAWAGSGAGAALAHGFSEAPAPGATPSLAWTLAAGGARTIRLVLPAYPTPGRALEAWAKTPHAARMEEARRYWVAEVERGARFELGDPETENAVRGALALLLACRERRGDAWLPIGSPLHYRDTWLRDGARVIQALALMGRTAEARALAAGFLDYQWEPGAFLSQRGQLDGTGHALWAMEQSLLRPAPADSLRRFADAALAAWRWCERQRALGVQAGLPFGAMLPHADPRDNELARAQLVGTDAWAIAGYRAASRILRAARRDREADSVDASRAVYVRDFAAALERSGARDVPPSWQNLGRDWGNLNVAAPCAALPASDPRCVALAERVWARAGGAGLATISDSLHYYVGVDLATWALFAGRRAAADSVLAAMLAWRSASGGAAEIFSRATRDFGRNPPPHGTSAAVLIALVRNALVHDEEDTLRLTMGARDSWWRGARVEDAPTRFGTIDLRFSRGAGEAAWEWTPVRVWTALTLPPGTRLAGAPPPPLARGASEDVVLAPPGTGGARVAIASVAGGAR